MTEKMSDKIMLLAGEPTHYCPGCKSLHMIHVSKPNPHTGAQWTFNGDYENPTFTPSVNIQSIGCHYFITNSQIQYCSDCTHEFNNMTIPLPNLPDWAL